MLVRGLQRDFCSKSASYPQHPNKTPPTCQSINSLRRELPTWLTSRFAVRNLLQRAPQLRVWRGSLWGAQKALTVVG